MHDFNYKAKVIRGGGYSRFKTGRLCISVGQEYHEGKKLEAALIWAKPRFGHLIISMADTLQRHNGISHEEARKAGDAWLARNAATIAACAPDAEIHRWDTWLEKPEYKTIRAAINRLYHKHPAFKADIDKAAQSYSEKRGTPAAACREYLLEETAVMAIQQQYSEAADIYPGTLFLWNRFQTETIPEAPESLAHRHYTRIGFTRVQG